MSEAIAMRDQHEYRAGATAESAPKAGRTDSSRALSVAIAVVGLVAFLASIPGLTAGNDEPARTRSAPVVRACGVLAE